MKVYVVTHVRPDMQVFPTYDKAFEFAKAKADKRRPCGRIWFIDKDDKETNVYMGIPWSENHIYIYEREM